MADFTTRLLRWYDQNKRDLPWRDITDPYKIWLSEIILQQTRIEQGTAYYHRFLEAFPTLADLAQAPQDEVMKLWQGLGYYSRARHLHQAAQTIYYELDNQFPATYHEIIKLKGVGTYTAAAIASLVFHEPVPAIDGNVFRFLARYFGEYTPINTAKAKKVFAQHIQPFVSQQQPGNFNQAMIDFGATHCKVKQPICEYCPFQLNCFAYNNQAIEGLPVKEQKTKITQRFFHYLFIKQGNQVFVGKRKGNDIWKNLYELPLIETPEAISAEAVSQQKQWNQWLAYADAKISYISPVLKHVLSHQHIFARLLYVQVPTNKTVVLPEQYTPTNTTDFQKLAIPRLLERLLEELEKGQKSVSL